MLDWERVFAERPERLSYDDVQATPAGGYMGGCPPIGKVLTVAFHSGPRYHLVTRERRLVYLREDLIDA